MIEGEFVGHTRQRRLELQAGQCPNCGAYLELLPLWHSGGYLLRCPNRCVGIEARGGTEEEAIARYKESRKVVP